MVIIKTCFPGYAMFGTGMLLIALSIHHWMFYLALIPYAMGSISNAAINSIYSNAVSSSERGEIRGALAAYFFPRGTSLLKPCRDCVHKAMTHAPKTSHPRIMPNI